LPKNKRVNRSGHPPIKDDLAKVANLEILLYENSLIDLFE
jgi:hypothetical protein